mmetsp:Transcript_123521/g.349178  ORF Transcript_123521/g.349178 Transcript_123521/m.349178 type:complete len:247 (+) Transcript_123521:734-1474(+)
MCHRQGPSSIVAPIKSRESRELRRRYRETCVVHAQRPEQRIVQKPVERLPRNDLDHSSDDVHAIGIFELGARWMQQWQRGEPLAEFRQCFHLSVLHVIHQTNVRLLRGAFGRQIKLLTIAEARAVREQSPQGDFRGNRWRFRHGVPFDTGFHRDVDIGEDRNKLCDVIFQSALAPLHKHHEACGHECLAHTVKAHEAVRAHRATSFQVGPTGGVHMQHAVPPNRHGAKARYDALVHLLADGLFVRA